MIVDEFKSRRCVMYLKGAIKKSGRVFVWTRLASDGKEWFDVPLEAPKISIARALRDFSIGSEVAPFYTVTDAGGFVHLYIGREYDESSHL